MEDEHNRKLLTEAFFVGAFLVPVFAFTHSVVTIAFPRMKDTTQDYLSVFISGGLFHLVAEGSGVNDWYLDNGVAVLKRLEKEKVEWTENINDPALCDGSCGWMEGICSHYSYHA